MAVQRGRTIRRLSLAVLSAAALLVVGVSAGGGGASVQSVGTRPATSVQIGKTITVNNRSYLVVNVLTALSYVPNSTIKNVARLVRLCRAARAFGMVAFRPLEVGAVAWLPRNPLRCLEVTGGGPGVACLQGRKNSDWFFVIAGTSERICAHLSTQVPGGWRARASGPSSGGRFTNGSDLLVKCQTMRRGNLWDFVVRPVAVSSLPVSRNPDWILDNYVPTGRDWLPGVPWCNGVSLFFG